MSTRNGRIRPVEALIAPAVAETVRNLEVSPEDAAAVRLAERYAAVIDDAAVIAAELAELHVDPDDVDTARRVDALAKRVDAQVVLAELGPKLLAALDALGATVKARAAVAKGKTAPAGGGKLAALRGGHAG